MGGEHLLLYLERLYDRATQISIAGSEPDHYHYRLPYIPYCLLARNKVPYQTSGAVMNVSSLSVASWSLVAKLF